MLARSKGADTCVSCQSNSNLLPIPYNEQTSQYQHQGLRSRIRSFGSHVKSKIHNHYGTVTTPSLNYQLEPSAGPNYPVMRSSKRAVLCGISYNNWKQYKLKGTVNDVRNMRDLLITRFGYPKEYIRVLTGMSHTVTNYIFFYTVVPHLCHLNKVSLILSLINYMIGAL